MAEVAVQFSVSNMPILHAGTMSSASSKRMRPATGNLFNHHQRSHRMQYSAVLPIISLSSISNFRERLARMEAKNKSTKESTTTNTIDFRLKMPSPDSSPAKVRPGFLLRSPTALIPKSSVAYPTTSRPSTSHRSQQQQQQQPTNHYLYIVNTPIAPRRSSSARMTNSGSNSTPLHQQPYVLNSPLLPRPNPQYGHFLAYLRRQSLARIRRKQQEEEGNTDAVETTITFNNNRKIPPTFCQSLSTFSLNTDTSAIPVPAAIPAPIKRASRPVSSFRSIQPRSSSSMTTSYRLNLAYPIRPRPSLPSSTLPAKKSVEDRFHTVASSSTAITPTNSVVGENYFPSMLKAPYELQLSGDMLNYCYVSDSGVKYQGQLLSSAV